MTEVDIDKVIFLSSFSGLGNNQNSQFSVDIPAQTIAANFGIIYVATTFMENVNSIPDIQIRYTGLSDNWITLRGIHFYTDPGFQFLISTRAFFSGNTLSVSNFLTNISGGSLALSAFTVDCNATLYSAPF